MTYLLVLLCGGCIGALLAIKFGRRRFPTLQERIDAIGTTATPAQIDDLFRLMEKRVLTFASRESLRCRLQIKVGATDICTEWRDHPVLLLPDVELFEATVLAATPRASTSKNK